MGMLAVTKEYRRLGIGRALLTRVIRRMRNKGCTSITLETETSNTNALALYEKLGFIKEELLVRYYLNLGDAYRMKLYFT
jgi:peptide alpha-N-acetyltransferase